MILFIIGLASGAGTFFCLGWGACNAGRRPDPSRQTWADGWRARERGLEPANCPYRDPLRRRLWLNGWHARDEALATRRAA
ncbi:MAG TPA: Rmf/CrpP family protein [Opitutaceae bacterium]|nr:Rmf/CrpP family protein [Opitutaceae bacterium]